MMTRRRAPITLDALGFETVGEDGLTSSQRYAAQQAAAAQERGEHCGQTPADMKYAKVGQTWDAYNMTCVPDGATALRSAWSQEAILAARAGDYPQFRHAYIQAGSFTAYTDAYNMTGAHTVPGSFHPLGYYGYVYEEFVMGTLAQIAAAAGQPGFDWTSALQRAAIAHAVQSNGRLYQVDTSLPVVFDWIIAESGNPAIQDFYSANHGPIAAGIQKVYQEIWNAHKTAKKAKFKKALLSIAAIVALPVVGYYATGAGAAAEGGAAAAGASAGELTAAEWAAGLTAEQIGGGAIAEAVASGALTAADWNAISAGMEGLAAESALQNVALAEIAGDVGAGTLSQMIGSEAAAEMLAQGAAVLGPQSAAASAWYADAGQAVTNKLVQVGKAQLAAELQREFLGDGEPQSAGTASGGAGADYGYEYGYGSGDQLDLEGDAELQSGFISGTMKKAAVPLTIGAALAMLALFALPAMSDERD